MSRDSQRTRQRRKAGRRLYVPALLMMLLTSPACAGHILPVPSVTIYPGDVIKDSWIVDRDFGSGGPAPGAAIADRAALVGKVAHHTLLPGLPISSNAVGAPRLIVDGQKVRIIFQQDGLEIETYAAALQAGGAGDVISVRNLDSGLTISGVVQSDGTVRVGG